MASTKNDTNNNNNKNDGNTTDRDGAKYKNNILNYYFAEKEKKNDNRGGGLKITNTNNLLIEDNNDELLFNETDINSLNNLYENSATTEEFYKELRKTNISKQGLNIITDPTRYNTRGNMMTPTAQKIPPNLPPLLPSTYGALELEMSDNPFVDQSMMSTSSKVPASNYNPMLDDVASMNGSKHFDGKNFTTKIEIIKAKIICFQSKIPAFN
jgi:hypothetical protein